MKKMIWVCAAAALALWLWWGNSALMVTEYRIGSKNLPAGFEGLRIAQVSDLHNAEFGNQNNALLSKLAETEPEIIVLTGDLIDCRRTDMAIALDFAQEAVKIAPCYYVTGNHEARLPEYPVFLDLLRDTGVVVLRNEAVTLEQSGDTISLLGLDDPVMVTKRVDGDDKPVLTAALQELESQHQGFAVLLSHRPEWFSLYRDFSVDLVFSGHAHGGQFRLPGLGGVFAPNQWFFPQYDAGVFTEASTAMVVSRGLGPSIFPLRINNRPEIVVAELHREG